jgi:nickel/cobalt exporter
MIRRKDTEVQRKMQVIRNLFTPSYGHLTFVYGTLAGLTFLVGHPLAAQERIVVGAPGAGSRLDLLRGLGASIRGLLAHGESVRGMLVLGLAGLAYGLIHALGPGHQKTLVAGTVLAEGGGFRGLAAAAGVAAASHAGAVLVFGLAFVAAERVFRGALAFGIAQERGGVLFAKSGAAVLAVIGLWSLIERIRQAIGRGRTCRSGFPVVGSVSDCPCGHEHRHGIAPQGIRGRSLAAIAAGSLAPCPGALVFLLLGISGGNAMAGVCAVLAVSAGMFITLLAVGWLALVARKASLAGAARRGTASVILSVLEIGGSLLVLCFALSLLL